jgi:hypothetical protein
MVVNRPAEESGHPVENAFDRDPDSWFRTNRDQSVAYGPHEVVLALGGRRMVDGFSISPRNDTYWKYGQVRDFEIDLADANGAWGKPVHSGTLERVQGPQVVRFDPSPGRLLRFRVLSTHDDGFDPMVVGAEGERTSPFDSTARVQVGSTTISELCIHEHSPSGGEAVELLGEIRDGIRLNGLEFERGWVLHDKDRVDLELEGSWQELRVEVGVDERSPAPGPGRFQVWADGDLLWDSGLVEDGMVHKPRLDIRGVRRLSLRAEASDPRVRLSWAEPVLVGRAGDVVRRVSVPGE